MSDGDDRDALLVRDRPGRMARILLCRVYGMECFRHFGDVLLTSGLSDGGEEEVVHIMLDRQNVGHLASFFKGCSKSIAQSEALENFPAVMPSHELPDWPGWVWVPDSKSSKS